jgi:hypothetical protein
MKAYQILLVTIILAAPFSSPSIACNYFSVSANAVGLHPRIMNWGPWQFELPNAVFTESVKQGGKIGADIFFNNAWATGVFPGGNLNLGDTGNVLYTDATKIGLSHEDEIDAFDIFDTANDPSTPAVEQYPLFSVDKDSKGKGWNGVGVVSAVAVEAQKHEVEGDLFQVELGHWGNNILSIKETELGLAKSDNLDGYDYCKFTALAPDLLFSLKPGSPFLKGPDKIAGTADDYSAADIFGVNVALGGPPLLFKSAAQIGLPKQSNIDAICFETVGNNNLYFSVGRNDASGLGPANIYKSQLNGQQVGVNDIRWDADYLGLLTDDNVDALDMPPQGALPPALADAGYGAVAANMNWEGLEFTGGTFEGYCVPISSVDTSNVHYNLARAIVDSDPEGDGAEIEYPSLVWGSDGSFLSMFSSPVLMTDSHVMLNFDMTLLEDFYFRTDAFFAISINGTLIQYFPVGDYLDSFYPLAAGPYDGIYYRSGFLDITVEGDDPLFIDSYFNLYLILGNYDLPIPPMYGPDAGLGSAGPFTLTMRPVESDNVVPEPWTGSIILGTLFMLTGGVVRRRIV